MATIRSVWLVCGAFLQSPSPASCFLLLLIAASSTLPLCGTLIGIALKLIDSLVNEAQLPGPGCLLIVLFRSELKLSGLFVCSCIAWFVRSQVGIAEQPKVSRAYELWKTSYPINYWYQTDYIYSTIYIGHFHNNNSNIAHTSRTPRRSLAFPRS